MADRTDSENRLAEGRTWSDFCDWLRAIGNHVTRPEVAPDPFTRAEGYRYFTHVLRSSFDIFIEHADPEFPVILCPCVEVVKCGGDDPDKYLQKAAISSAHSYRIRGMRCTVQYVSFLTQGSGFEDLEKAI